MGKKISLNPEISMNLKEFKKLFESHFLHIVPKDRAAAMKAEFDRITEERKQLDHDVTKAEAKTEPTNEGSSAKADEQNDTE